MITKKFILGSEEWCGLPQLKIPAVKAKIDTGAKTSSIHAVNINPFEQDGIPYISFDVYPIDNTISLLSLYYLDGNAGGPGLKASLNIQIIIVWK